MPHYKPLRTTLSSVTYSLFAKCSAVLKHTDEPRRIIPKLRAFLLSWKIRICASMAETVDKPLLLCAIALLREDLKSKTGRGKKGRCRANKHKWQQMKGRKELVNLRSWTCRKGKTETHQGGGEKKRGWVDLGRNGSIEKTCLSKLRWMGLVFCSRRKQ